MANTPLPGLDSPTTSVDMDVESIALLEQLMDFYRDAYRSGQALNSLAELLRGCPEGYTIGAADLHVLVSPWTEAVNTFASDFFSLCRGFSEATARPSTPAAASLPATASVTLRPPADLYGDQDDKVVPMPRGRSPQALVQAVQAWVDARCAEGASRLSDVGGVEPIAGH